MLTAYLLAFSFYTFFWRFRQVPDKATDFCVTFLVTLYARLFTALELLSVSWRSTVVAFPHQRGFVENVRPFILRLRLFFFFFGGGGGWEASFRKLISHFMPGSVHSGSAS